MSEQIEQYDGPRRFLVPSRRKGELPYLVDLDEHKGSGACCCAHYTMRIEPLLNKGYLPAVAVSQGLVAIPEWGTVANALQCWHIFQAHRHYRATRHFTKPHPHESE